LGEIESEHEMLKDMTNYPLQRKISVTNNRISLIISWIKGIFQIMETCEKKNYNYIKCMGENAK